VTVVGVHSIDRPAFTRRLAKLSLPNACWSRCAEDVAGAAGEVVGVGALWLRGE
jgi:hypothetical protein